MNKSKNLSVVAAVFSSLFLSSTAVADDKTLDLDLLSYDKSEVLSENGIVIDDVNVSVSAWTYTKFSTDWVNGIDGWQKISKTNVGEINASDAEFVGKPTYTRDYGYGVINNNESNNHHTIDNIIDYTTQDGWQTAEGFRNFDYVLLSFDKAVSLNTVSLGWHAGSDQQLSVASLADDNLAIDSWSTMVKQDSLDNAIAASFNIMGDQLNGLANLGDTFNTEFSTYWLVGAYNKVFGDIGGKQHNDAFKLAGINFDVQQTNSVNPPAEVSEPGALALMSLGLGVLLYRRKRRV
jgi:hypothetical protein